MTPPLVSVIVPCFRQARYLSGAIDSVLGQTYRPVEVIVVDDGSDDDTAAVAGGYGERVRYVRKANGGAASARNAGIRTAAGKYLLFLDADDLLHPEALGWLVEAMGEEEGRVCVMGFRKFYADSAREEGPANLPPGERPLARALIFQCLGPPHVHLCSKALAVRVGGFDEQWRNWCEDWDFWRRLALAGAEFVAVPRVGAYYRQHAGTNSSDRVRMDMMFAKSLLLAQREVAAHPELLARWGYTPAEVRRRFQALLQEFMLGAAYRLEKRGDFRRSLAYYVGSIYRGGWSSTALRGLAKLVPHILVWYGRRLRGLRSGPKPVHPQP